MKLLNWTTYSVKKVRSRDGSVTYFIPKIIGVFFFNPFSRYNPLINPWFHKIPSGGFHFLGFRVALFYGEELRDKRIIH